MKQEVADRLEVFAEAAWNLKDSDDYVSWERRLVAFLNAVAEEQVAKKIQDLGGPNIIT